VPNVDSNRFRAERKAAMDTSTGTRTLDATEATIAAVRAEDSDDKIPVDVEETLIEEISIDGMCGVY
jgi:mycofactocin precursor